MDLTRGQLSVRIMTAVSAALGVVAFTPATPARAVPPPNDTAATATAVTTLPMTFEADTREATVDSVHRDCVGGRSVWYRHRPPTTARVKIATIGSSYDTVLAVYQGARSPSTRIACNDDAAGLASAVQPRLAAGRKYWIAVSSCCGRRSGRGGDLVLRLYQGGTPDLQLTVDSAEAGAVSGRLRIHGTVSCATPSAVFAEVVVSQAVGQNVARGWGWLEVNECLVEPTEWVARVDSETGWAFQPGTVAAEGHARGYDGFSSSSTSVEENLPVTVDPIGKRHR